MISILPSKEIYSLLKAINFDWLLKSRD